MGIRPALVSSRSCSRFCRQVAYVLGPLQNKTATEALSGVLKDVHEHPMVRHEAVEALGSIADGQCVAHLEEFIKDPEPIISQSREVALSMLEFEKAGKTFEVILEKDYLFYGAFWYEITQILKC